MNPMMIVLALFAFQFFNEKKRKQEQNLLNMITNPDILAILTAVGKLSDKKVPQEERMSVLLELITNPIILDIIENFLQSGLFNKKTDGGEPRSDDKEGDTDGRKQNGNQGDYSEKDFNESGNNFTDQNNQADSDLNQYAGRSGLDHTGKNISNYGNPTEVGYSFDKYSRPDSSANAGGNLSHPSRESRGNRFENNLSGYDPNENNFNNNYFESRKKDTYQNNNHIEQFFDFEGSGGEEKRVDFFSNNSGTSKDNGTEDNRNYVSNNAFSNPGNTSYNSYDNAYRNSSVEDYPTDKGGDTDSKRCKEGAGTKHPRDNESVFDPLSFLSKIKDYPNSD